MINNLASKPSQHSTLLTVSQPLTTLYSVHYLHHYSRSFGSPSSPRRGDAAVLVLLDLTAVFDTVAHEILLERMRVTFGVDSFALLWFRSYFASRRFVVAAKALLFLMSSVGYQKQKDLSWDKYYSLYTDISVCVNKISSWMCWNRLQLNADKTEVRWCHVCRQLQLPRCPISVAGASIESVNAVRDLGVFIDNYLGAASRDRRTVSRCFAALGQQQLRHLYQYFTSDRFCSLMMSVVHSIGWTTATSSLSLIHI